jgi:hypothetical protein
MHEIKESIVINAPVEKVFSFIKNVEARMRLNPFWETVMIKKLTPGEPAVGSRFRVVIKNGDRRADYVNEWIEYEENKKIVSRETTGRIKLTLTVKEIPEGTLLTHKEEFEIPAEAVYQEDSVNEDAPFWKRFLKFFALLSKGFKFFEYTQKVEDIKENLRSNLRVWLKTIKENIEMEKA